MSDEILGTLPAIMTRGWKGDLHCTLVFTSQRLIVSIKGLLAQASASGVFATGGAVGAALGGAAASAREKNVGPGLQSPEEILQTNKKNFQVTYSQISRIELGKKLGTSRLYIRTPDETHKFKFQGITLEQVETSIRSLLPTTVRLERSDRLD